MQPIERKRLQGGVRIEIHYDDSPECPLEWEQNKKTVQTPEVYFIAFQRNSYLTDYHHFGDPEEVRPFADEHGYEMFNLFYYEHGLCSYNISPYSCPWDSGQVGYILVKKDAGPNLAEIAKGLCETITDWCNGSVYGYQILNEDGDVLNSCWGYYGLDDCMKEAEMIAETYVSEALDDEAREQEDTRPDLYGT